MDRLEPSDWLSLATLAFIFALALAMHVFVEGDAAQRSVERLRPADGTSTRGPTGTADERAVTR